jgi:ATPase subunit of ABC transporter with duplicated ATPase domains
MQPTIVATDLSFSWPDGEPLFERLDFAIGAGRTGLIGANGCGKSTLLRLIAGALAPTRGTVGVEGNLGYLRQDLTLDTTAPVDRVLGVAAARAALRAVERGEATDRHFTAIGDDWDVEARARATLDRLGLSHIDLDQPVGAVSGGEAVLLGLAAQFLRRPDVLLLDEPTNNLDLAARERLYANVLAFPGVLVVVSHDRDLLELVDQIGEVRDGGVTWYGGTLSDYEAAVAAEQEAAERMVRAASADVRRQRRELIEAQTKLDRRKRYGKKMQESRRQPKIVANTRKRQAQNSAGKHRTLQLERLEDARERLAGAEEEIRHDDEIRVDLPETAVPAGRTVLVLREAVLRCGARVDLTLRGPERVALLGANGSGKTTLLRAIVGELPPVSGVVDPAVPLRYLPQRLDVLDDAASVLSNVVSLAPGVPPGEARSRLARFAFRGDRVERPVGTLSGGERFRATLAALLLARPAPQLLLLDEPTNNLDLASVRQLAQALAGYRGALLIASHDLPFLREIGVTRWLRLTDQLSEVDEQ